MGNSVSLDLGKTIRSPLAQKEDSRQVVSVQRQDVARTNAAHIAKLLDEYRGEDTLVLDLTSITPIVDYFVITTASSSRQMRSMAEEVHKTHKHAGHNRQGIEGENSTEWILLDYGDVVVHVFSPAARNLYDLEHLWADAPRIDWRALLGLPPAKPTVPPVRFLQEEIKKPALVDDVELDDDTGV